MLYKNLFLIFFWHCLFFDSEADDKLETSFNINGKKVLNYVSDKFLSISIDPAVLLAGVNLSETSLRLAKHLSPAYIRLAGLSTEFVKYVDEDMLYSQMDTNSVTITPSMWFGINEWLALTNLTPIYGINDVESSNDVWNPKSLLPLLELSDKLNVSCLWQLGYDATNKSDIRYKQDLNILHHILAAFPERNETWKIVGSDISHIPENSLQNTVQELEDITTAVMWEPSNIREETFLERNIPSKLISGSKIRFWTTVPKSFKPVTFDSACAWGNQVGSAAQKGYDVIFRQPRMLELFSVTPVYWFSYLYKRLIGRNVLEAKISPITPGISAFAYCSRKQNSFVRRGALSVMAINVNEETIKIKVRLGTSVPEKSMEVQEYILTSSGDNSTDVFLNGNLILFENIFENPLTPKVRRTKTSSHVPLFLPPKSIGFFVLPGARISVCIDQEIETDLILEEIEEDQNIPLLEEIGLTLATRSLFGRNQMLEDIAHQLKSEMLLDQTYYKSPPQLQARVESMKEQPEQALEKNMERGRKFFIDRAKLSQKQKKQIDFDKKKETLKKFLEKNRLERVESQPKVLSKSRNIELTSEEVQNILKDRAMARAAQRNIIFTDEELNALIHKASKKFFNSGVRKSVMTQSTRNKRHINIKLLEKKQNSLDKSYSEHHNVPNFNKLRSARIPRDANQKFLDHKSKLEGSRMRLANRREELLINTRMAKENIQNKMGMLKTKHSGRFRRDINMDLLKIKSEGQKKKVQLNESPVFIKNYEEKTATIRKPGQTSDELFEELKKEMGSVEEVQTPVKTDVFAKLADSEEDDEEESLQTITRPKKLKLFDKKTKNDPFGVVSPQIGIIDSPTKRKKNKVNKPKADDDLQFLTASEEFTDIEEGEPCIHEFFGKEWNVNNNKKRKSYYMHELGELSSDENIGKHKKQKKTSKSTESEFSSEGFELRRKREMHSDQQKSKLGMSYPTLGNLVVPRDIGLTSEPQVAKLGSKEFDSVLPDNLSIEPIKKILIEEKLTEKLKNGETILEVISENIGNDQKLEEKHQTALTTTSELEPIGVQEDINSDLKSEENNIHAANNERTSNHKFMFKPNLQGKVPFISDDRIEDVISRQSNDKDIKESSVKENQESMENNQNRDDNSDLIKTSPQTSSTLDLHQLGHIIEKPEDPRLKREKLGSSETNPDTKHEKNIYQKDVKQHFKDLKDIIARDKLKFEEEKRKNRQKLLQLKKQQEEFLVHDTDNIMTKIHKDELARRQELLEQINVMKKKLQKRKNEIDSMLLKDVQHKEEENEELVRQINKNTLGKLSKDIDKVLNFGESKEITGSRYKRSLFEPTRFGNYQPLTLNLKTWKPADVLSLKREQFLGSNSLTPPNDYHIFKNIFDKNRRYGYIRRRRNIEYGQNNIENELDGHLDMPYKFSGAKEYTDNKKDKKLTLNGSAKTQENSIEKNRESVGKTEMENQPDSFINLRKNIEENEILAKNISNSITDGKTEVMKSILSSLSEFLKKLGTQLGNYMKGITLM